MADAPGYCVYCRTNPCYCVYCRPNPCLRDAAEKTCLKPLLIDTEFHRLVTGLQDAMHVISTTDAGCASYSDAYAALSQRRKELYEWVGERTPRPAPGFTISLRF